MVKSREKKVTNVEAQLLKTAAKQALGGGSGGKKGEGESGTSPVMTYKDKDEQMLRDKLVNKLKEKEVNSSKFYTIVLKIDGGKMEQSRQLAF